MLDPEYQMFSHENPLFAKLIHDKGMLTPDEIQSVERDFKVHFPNKDFNTFLADHNIYLDDLCMDVPIFDTKLKRTYNANVLNPIRRSKIESFNMQEFLTESIQNNQLCYLNFDPSPLELDSSFDDFSFENESTQQINLARESLKDIAKLVLFVNQQKKEIPYTILEVIQQRYIN